ncbi:hypothetical protein GKZ68_20715 (plasmid) [Hymenobacter sp. BRD128]|uniref:hypothetical protein n=1 Tax=Hymenobacter sp. BRD128 TaxID=2675878 RepID=UPI0015654EF2|nr:hypothetical protein [Hymenobacter sp. BRD128]QKG59107.1 hypothetical protein GKZ68_20715 [Hymenobacter sp. BRD128]
MLHCPSGHDLLLNQATVDLLYLLDGAPTLAAARQQFNSRFEATLSQPEFEGLLGRQLGGYQVLALDEEPARAAITGPLHHRLELIPTRVAGWLASPLTKLYHPAVFWPVLTGLSLALLTLVQVEPVPNTVPTTAGAVALFYFSVPVHELGHIAACRRAGARHGGIGVGVYYFFPLLYADITGIWQAAPHARLVANLGGIFSQLLYAGGLAGAGLLLHQADVLLVAEAVAISAAWQLNPFLQHDGYWVLSDLSHTPNLLSRARDLRRTLLSRAGLRRAWARPLAERLRDRRAWVLLYGLLNTSLLLTLLAYALYHSRQVLPQLPALGHTIVSKLFQGTLTLADLPGQALTVLAVYGWLLRKAAGRVLRARRRPVTRAS